jgi:hypothetical protein
MRGIPSVDVTSSTMRVAVDVAGPIWPCPIIGEKPKLQKHCAAAFDVPSSHTITSITMVPIRKVLKSL